MNRASFSVSFKCLVLLVCYVPIISVYLPETHFGLGIPDLTIDRVLSYLLVFVFMLELTVSKQLSLNLWLFTVLSFILMKCMSLCWSKWYSYNVHVCQMFSETAVIPFIVGVVAVNVFSDENAVKKFIKHVVRASLVLSVIAVYQFIFISDSIASGRSAGTMNNPNLLAIYLVLCLPCLLYSIEEKIISKGMGLIFQLSIIAGVVSTISRKGIITTVICYFLYFVLLKKFKVVILCVMVFVLLGGILSFNESISARFTRDNLEYNIQGRANMAAAGFKMFLDEPIIGNGYNGYYKRFGEFFPKAWRSNYDAHNAYVTVIVNYGLVGFALFMGIFCYPLYIARKKIKLYNQGILLSAFQKNMSIICICATLPLMLNIYFAGAIWSQANLLFMYYSIIAFVFCESNETETE